MPATQDLDPDRLQAFLARYGADQAATAHAATVVLGERLGLYRALADGGPQTAPELAAATGCQPRLIQEWLNAQAASDYCEHDPATGRYWLTPEQTACLADEDHPMYVAGGMLAANTVHRTEGRVREAFTRDGAVAWHEHPAELFPAVEQAFRVPYTERLTSEWIPALDGVAERLARGGRVADLGCGYGLTTVLMAQAFPASTFSGFDTHAPSIDVARKRAADAGVSDRVTFEVAEAGGLPGATYDLVCVFNALHEFGDPAGALAHVRRVLADDGTVAVVEPNASEALAPTDDPISRSPVSRNFHAVSTLVCVPNALSQGATRALGAQAPDGAMRDVAAEAGFTRFRRATESPLHRVLEIRP